MSRVGQFGQISEINDHLYLSGAGVLKPEKIRDKKITCIVNATVEEPNAYLNGVDYLKIRVDDSPFAHLDTYFDLVAEKIKSTKERGGRTLVHCVAGVSRSASLCIAYLMKYQRMPLRAAYFHVKSARPIIRPNPGFWKQMIEYELRLFNQNSVRLVQTLDGESLPDVYTEEVRRAVLAASSWRSSSTGPTPSVRRPLGPSRTPLARRSPSPAVMPSWSARHSQTYSGSSLSALALVGAPVKSQLKGNLFSSLYNSHNEILFPNF